ncbi:hypothetical protein [Streptomyces sp. NPDC091217]|uniref:hypothetical protein n=1 Tax=Streptomyces sp. NPDC091217 TaxID=3365975 RepID=UPI00382CBD56
MAKTAHTAGTVTVYDIDWDLNWPHAGTGELKTPWDEMSIEDADDQLALSRDRGETVSTQEYRATDRGGWPLLVVLLKEVPEAHQTEDLGAVYEYAL